VTITGRRKLIEVALPLEAINAASAREKSIRHGHPSTLHHWWSRKPLATCRAVLLASLVDDPSARPDEFPTEESQQAERARLFRLVESIVAADATADEEVLEAARAEILRSCGGASLQVLDPFCGGGAIPLEAQRLGLEAHASDLNPVAVLITKALIEIPPRFAGRPPVHPEEGRSHAGSWTGARGLAEDLRWYGRWIREEASRRIGELYPAAVLPPELGGGKANVIGWLWVRTITCPNPACGIRMPLASKWTVSNRAGKARHADPVPDRAAGVVRFVIRDGRGPAGSVTRRGAACVACGEPVSLAHVRGEGKAGRMGTQLMAIAAEGVRERIYLPPDDEHERAATSVEPHWAPGGELPRNPRYVTAPNYGMTHHRDLFMPRQLVALATFADLIQEARKRVLADARAGGMRDDELRLAEGGAGALAYADAIATYLALALDKQADLANALCRWEPVAQCPRQLFGRQAIPMVWDFAEGNPLGSSSGSWSVVVEGQSRAMSASSFPRSSQPGFASQLDAMRAPFSAGSFVCTDPPYYDNIPYSDLSDFFYVWLRKALSGVWPLLFSTLLTPKAEELVADPMRFGGSSERADDFFEQGLKVTFERLRSVSHPDLPLILYYAFKQAEDDGETGIASTGWEKMLAALIRTGFMVTGTWPMRTEATNRMRNLGSNALASSIVLVCRPRAAEAALTTRREFLGALRRELPDALRDLQRGNIAPVDLAQAAIGPGMAVFTRYARVVEADGSPMTVRTALGLINRTLDEILAEQEGDFDADTRWAVAWFEQYGAGEGPFGVAENLFKAKATSLEGLKRAGVLRSQGGKVRLLAREELPDTWDPATDQRLTVWEVTQHLICAQERGGEQAAAELLRRVGGLGEVARELAYRLFVVCERKGWAQEALSYNGLVVSWPEIQRIAAEAPLGQQTLGV